MSKLPSTAWGHPDRYYSRSPVEAMRPLPGTPPRPDPEVGRWAELLQLAAPGVQTSVERTYKQWNNILRDYLRSETALRLTVGEEAQAVPVRIVAGMPAPFAEVLKQFHGLEWLLLNRPMVETATKATSFMEKNIDQARSSLGADAGAATKEEIQHVRATAELWLQTLDRVKALEQLAGINQDVLGAYFFRTPEIRIYWMVIGILSAALGVSAEALTTVTLAHELAHAYTHLGRDIDDERWETEVMAATDLEIVEGLAQYYAHVLCKRLEPRMPDVLKAYEALLEKQSKPYRAHRAWVGDSERGGEIIRVSMIECRSCGRQKTEAFVDAIKHHRLQVKGHKTPPNV